MTIIDEIRPYTLVSDDRKWSILRSLEATREIPGEIAELGVYRGGIARMMAKTCPDKTVHLFDTFSGMPMADAEIDLHKEGDFADTSLAAVTEYLADCPNVQIHAGLFPSTTAEAAHDNFSLLHLDADLYSSTMAGLTFFWPRLSAGGVIILDDFKWPHCPGVKKAIDDYFSIRPQFEKRFTRISSDATHQLTVLKSAQ